MLLPPPSRAWILSWAAAAAAFAQQITVRSATGNEVSLAWSGPAQATWAVERATANGAFAAIGETTVRLFRDNQVDPFAAYRYRVRSAVSARLSSEVTVGPPPAGMQAVAIAPKSAAKPESYGIRSSLSLDENGDPAVAFVAGGNQIRFVRWNRASYSWAQPVVVASIGAIELDGVEPVALAIDRASGVAAIAFPKAGEAGVNIAFSRDRGKTWSAEHFQAGLATAANATALALYKDRFHLAANLENNGPVYITGGAGTPASAWTSLPVPPAGQQHHDHSNVAIALNLDQQPYLAFADQAEAGGILYAVWRPGQERAVTVADSSGAAEAFPGLALAIAGGRYGLLFTARRDAASPHSGVWFAASTNAVDWSAPVRLPVSGPRSSNRPIALAAGPRDVLAAVFGSSQGTGPSSCAYPQTALSSDFGATWRPCGVTAPPDQSPLEPQPETLGAAFSGNGKLFVLAHAGDDAAGRGLFLWRQP